MKKFRSGLAIFLMAAMLFSLMPVNVFAAGSSESNSNTAQENTRTAEAEVTSDNLTVSGNNSFGDLLAKRLNSSGSAASGSVDGYSVKSLEMTGKTAKVAYKAAGKCTLVVAVYTDDGLKMVASGKKTVAAGEDTAEVAVTIDTMPRYYLVKAFLVDPINQYSLCSAYICELYTQPIQEVKNSTVEDYQDREILNLDSSNDTNFAVYGDEVTIVDSSTQGTTYQASASDPDKGKYVFGNADSSFASMKAGDTFSYDKNGTLIIGKVKTITVTAKADGTKTVTIQEDSNIEMSDVFDYVKIENNNKIDSYELDDSVADEGVTDIVTKSVSPSYKGIDVTIEDEQDVINIPKHIEKKKEFGGSSSEGNVEFTADLSLKITFKVTAYASFENCYVDMSVNTNAELHAKLTGSYSLSVKLPGVSAKLAGGAVKLGFVPTLKFGADGKITVDASFSYKIGFNCSTQNGLVRTGDDTPVTTFEAKAECELYFGIEFSPSVTFIEAGVSKTKHYLAKLTVPIELGVKISGEMILPPDHVCKKCIAGKLKFHIEITPSVKLLVKENMSSTNAKKEYSKKLLDRDFEISDWYYSFDFNQFGMETCPYKHIIITGKCGDDVTYTLYDDGRLEFTGSGSMTNFSDTGSRPWNEHLDKIKKITFDNAITSIGNFAFRGCEKATSVKLPTSLKKIGSQAFYGCTGLTSISIPGSVTSIGGSAFGKCSKLKSVAIPDSVTSVSSSTFSGCTALTSVTIPKSVTSIYASAFSGCTAITDVYYAGSERKWNLVTIDSGNNSLTSAEIHYGEEDNANIIDSGKCGENITYTLYADGLLELSGTGDMYDYNNKNTPWYSNTEKVKEVQFFGNITSISGNAFKYCYYLSSITIPSSVTSIGNSAFYRCRSLTRLIIPNSVTLICDYAFSESSNLTNISIPDSVISIGNAAFRQCESLNSISIPNSVKTIGSHAFYGCTSLTNVTLSNSISTIEDSLFGKCSNLSSISIPDSVTSISTFAFSSCDNLTSITIPNSVKAIGESAFISCKNLRSITIPDSVTSIGPRAFENCERLTSIALSNSLSSISESTFWSCKSLSSISIPNSVTIIGKNSFCNCKSLTNITISNSVKTIDYGAFSDCTKLTSITIPNSVKTVGNYVFSECESLTSVSIANSVTSIGEGAFAYCVSLTSISIPNSVTFISNYTFHSCESLKNIAIPNSVTAIGAGAFNFCESLEGINIPSSVTRIGNRVFEGCENLKSIIIPKGVSYIDEYTFQFCKNLTSITIPQSVNSINRSAFSSCNNLKDVYYQGSQSDWDSISISDSYNDPLFSATIHYNSTGPSSSPAPMRAPDTDGTLTASFDNLIPNQNYLVVVSKTNDTETMLDADNLLYIDEKTADASGKLVCSYQPRVKYDNAVVKTIIQINDKPSIVTQPADVTVKSGESLTVSVKAKGTGLTYQWYFKKPGQTAFSAWSGRTHASETCTPNETWNGIQLYCVVKDSIGQKVQSKTIKVTFSDVITIVAQPNNVTAKTGDSVKFEVCAEGKDLTYQWYYKKADATSWSLWNGRTTASTSATSNATWDGMQVRCLIKNSGGKSLYSDAAKIILSDIFGILQQPSDITTQTGKSATFTIKAKGAGLTYQWYYKKADDTSWSLWNGRTTASITATSNATWDGMKVRCIVKDSSGASVTSKAAKIILSDILGITQQPSDVTTQAGQNATFTIKAKGAGITYQWYYKKAGATSWSLWNGRTTASITATSNATWDGMKVRCKVTDSTGKYIYTNSATITLASIIITKQPTSQTITLGTPVTLSLTATGSGLTYQWYFKKSGQSSFSAWNGRTHASETCTPNATWNGIQLYCIVKDSANNTMKSNTVTVTVKSGPVITKQPASQTITLGNPVTLSLTATGSGLTYQWYFKKSGQTSFSTWNGRTHASETCTPNATWNGIQLYCIVKDSAGNKAQSNTVTVKVNTSGITITQQPKNQSIIAGKEITLSVKATGSSLKYQWYFKKKGQTSFSVWNGRTHASETVSPNNTWDGIQLYCKITDGSGKTLNSSTVTVSVLSITTQPSNVTVAAGKDATFKVKATGSGLKYQWQYKKSGATHHRFHHRDFQRHMERNEGALHCY